MTSRLLEGGLGPAEAADPLTTPDPGDELEAGQGAREGRAGGGRAGGALGTEWALPRTPLRTHPRTHLATT